MYKIIQNNIKNNSREQNEMKEKRGKLVRVSIKSVSKSNWSQQIWEVKKREIQGQLG